MAGKLKVPVFAIGAIIILTVILTFIMLLKIWVPEWIDDEITRKFLLSYLTILFSAWIVFALADKFMKLIQAENQEERDERAAIPATRSEYIAESEKPWVKQ